MPKADDEAKAYFRSLVPDDPRVEVKPMFGNLAAFVNKNMFLALFGDQVAVRLPEADRSKLLREPGSSVFEPMPGRPMGEYVALPPARSANRWRQRRLRAKNSPFTLPTAHRPAPTTEPGGMSETSPARICVAMEADYAPSADFGSTSLNRQAF